MELPIEQMKIIQPMVINYVKLLEYLGTIISTDVMA